MPLILVAGEFPESPHWLQQLLERHGHEVIEADTLPAVLTAASQRGADVVILDAEIWPDGINACTQLRLNHPHLPILMIVPADTAVLDAALKAGTTDIISPPIPESVFLHRLSHLCDFGQYASLLRREAWSQSIIDNAIEGIYRSTVDGRFLMVNPALVKLLGYDTADEVMALNIRDDLFVHPHLRDELVARYEFTDAALTEVVWRRRDGKHITLQGYGRAVRDSAGSIRYFEGTVLDITERRRAEAALVISQAELQFKSDSLTTINAISDAVYHSLDVQTVLERGLQAVMDYLNVPGSSIYLVNESAGTLVRMATMGVSARLSNVAASLSINRSLNGECVLTHQIVISNDPPHDDRIAQPVQQALAAASISQIIVVPLLFQEQVIGTLSLPLNQQRDLNPQERMTLLAVGKTIGLAIAHAQYVGRVEAEVEERLRAEQAERQQRLLAEALRDTAAALNSDLDHEGVLERILTHMQRVIPCDTVNVMLIADGVMSIVRARGYRKLGITDEHLMNIRYSIDETPNFRWMIEKGYGLAIPNVHNFPGWIVDDITSWIASHLSAPIIVDGEVIGFLNLDSAVVDTFQQIDADTLKIFADQAGIAIRNARLYDATRRHADILEQRVEERTAELAVERAKLQAILDGIADGVIGVIYDEAINRQNYLSIRPSYRYVNQAMYQVLGYTMDEMVQAVNLDEDVLSHQFLGPWAELIEHLLETGFWYTEKQFRRKDDSLFDVSVRATAVWASQGEVIGAIIILRDVSQEKQLEQQKARFISNAAHELRTPITNLKTRLYLAQKQPEQMATHLRILEYVTDHIKDLAENLLDLSRLERGTLQLQRETLELDSFIARVVEIQMPEAENRDLHLLLESPSAPLVVSADPGRLNQVITNLISNAINHTPSGGDIKVILARGYDHPAKCAVIRVCDTGVGIKPDHLPHIFQPFYQANQGSSSMGMGLGLSISKEIIELHGGTIYVDSTEGKGTCFSVELQLLDTYP